MYGCNQDRIACSTRSYGIAIVFAWILIATKAETGWETCTVGEGKDANELVKKSFRTSCNPR